MNCIAAGAELDNEVLTTCSRAKNSRQKEDANDALGNIDALVLAGVLTDANKADFYKLAEEIVRHVSEAYGQIAYRPKCIEDNPIMRKKGSNRLKYAKDDSRVIEIARKVPTWPKIMGIWYSIALEGKTGKGDAEIIGEPHSSYIDMIQKYIEFWGMKTFAAIENREFRSDLTGKVGDIHTKKFVAETIDRYRESRRQKLDKDPGYLQIA